MFPEWSIPLPRNRTNCLRPLLRRNTGKLVGRLICSPDMRDPSWTRGSDQPICASTCPSPSALDLSRPGRPIWPLLRRHLRLARLLRGLVGLDHIGNVMSMFSWFTFGNWFSCEGIGHLELLPACGWPELRLLC